MWHPEIPEEFRNQIVTGDARDLSKRLPPDGIDLVVLEPPYNIGFKYDLWPDNLSNDDYIEMLCVFQRFPRIVAIHYPEEMQKWVNAALGNPKHTGAWCYNSNTRRRFRLINYYGCEPDYSRLTQPYKNPTDRRIQQLIENGRNGSEMYEWWSDIQQVKNVSDEKTSHPCQVPVALIERIILLTTNPGDVILDPFAGSGTTAEAALRNGRNFIGFDISPNYTAIARERVNKTLVPLFILSPEPQQLSF